MERQSPYLIAYDGSENARYALTRASEILDRSRPAIVLYVWQPVGATDEETIAANMAAEGAQLANEAGLDTEARTIRAVSPTWEVIVEAADDLGAASIVLGSQGLRSLRTLILGSVSHQVVHHAHQPVLVIPLPALVDIRRESALKRRVTEPAN